MNRDRIVQFVCIAVIGCAIVGAALMVPSVNRQRRDLQLTFDTEVGDQTKPTYAALGAGLGSFRGVAVNALWYRAEMEKQAKRFDEANILAKWITELQPRFPKVWEFHAWNLAYNISVETFTPEERWGWVSAGLDLLRDEGLRWNPNAARLYRELAWLFFHKIGGFADDMNWYYKAEVAREWQELLGGPQDFVTNAQATDAMGEIADVADLFLAFNRPSRDIVAQLEALAAPDPAAVGVGPVEPIADALDELRQTSVLRLRDRLVAIREALVADGDARAADRMTGLMSAVEAAASNAESDPVTLYRAAYPEVGAIIGELRAAGFDLDARTLRTIGRVMLYMRYGPPEWVATSLPAELRGPDLLPMLQLLTKPDESGELRDGLARLMPFLRARVLLENYNMDPAFMHRLMLEYGACDWRNPGSHALYWYAMGLERAFTLREAGNIDFINTSRGVNQSLQYLFQNGTVLYNPLMPVGLQVDLNPDLAFMDAYGKSLLSARADAESGVYGEDIDLSLFDQGYENFLQDAVEASYLYGSEGLAQQKFIQLRERFGDSQMNNNYGLYETTLEDFVLTQLQDGDKSQQSTRRVIESLIRRAVMQGLAYSDMNLANRLLTTARGFHERYQADRDYQAGFDTEGGALRTRIGLDPFPTMLQNIYVQIMSDARLDLAVRQNIFRATPLPMVQATYVQFTTNVRQQLPPDVDIERVFPPPPGVELNPGEDN